MARLPRLSGKEVRKALEKSGFVAKRQHGSHVFMVKETLAEKIPTVVQMHTEIDIGILLEIIRQAKVTKPFGF